MTDGNRRPRAKGATTQTTAKRDSGRGGPDPVDIDDPRLASLEVVRAGRLEIVDDQGRVRAELGIASGGGFEQAGSVSLRILDAGGQTRAWLGTDARGEDPGLMFTAPPVEGGDIVAVFGVNDDLPSTSLWMEDPMKDPLHSAEKHSISMPPDPAPDLDDACECEYAERDWHDGFLRVEDDLDIVRDLFLAAEGGHEADEFKRFVALHSWRNPALVYDVAEIVDHHRELCANVRREAV